MMGAFFELGPCLVTEEGDHTIRNPSSWTNVANMVFVEYASHPLPQSIGQASHLIRTHSQPIGVGFSDPGDPSLWAENLDVAAIDFDKFFDGFFALFPEQESGREVIFAGESFGGKYVPIYASRSRRTFDSIILVDPYIDYTHEALGLYEHFCVSGEERVGMNKTECEAIERAYPTCERHGEICRSTYDPVLCKTAMVVCDETVASHLGGGPHGRNPYDDRVECGELPLCGTIGTCAAWRSLALYERAPS